MRLFQKTVVSAANAAANVNGNAIPVGEYTAFSLSANVNSTAAGTIKLQGSNDNDSDENGANVGNWIDITGSSVAISSGNDVMWNATAVGYAWVRPVYTFSSGTGNLTVTFTGKAPTGYGRPYYSA